MGKGAGFRKRLQELKSAASSGDAELFGRVFEELARSDPTSLDAVRQGELPMTCRSSLQRVGIRRAYLNALLKRCES
jgi:hypothetical protein